MIRVLVLSGHDDIDWSRRIVEPLETILRGSDIELQPLPVGDTAGLSRALADAQVAVVLESHSLALIAPDLARSFQLWEGKALLVRIQGVPEALALAGFSDVQAFPRDERAFVDLPEGAREAMLIELAGAIREAATIPTEPSDLVEDWELEGHVAEALVAARRLAADGQVGAVHVLRAIAGLPRLKSDAFDQLRRLLKGLPLREAALADGHFDQQAMRGLRLDGPMSRMLAFARQDRSQNGSVRKLWGRDLIAAALLAKDFALAHSLLKDGIELQPLQDEWYRFVTNAGRGRSLEEWRDFWRFAGVPTPTGRRVPGLSSDPARAGPDSSVQATPHSDAPLFSRAGYNADTTNGVDRLGVERDAEALARLILDRAVDPPLSIGLLGDWGSGKSFFIEQLKREIGELGGGAGLHREVVQIHFNAWHVSDSNLWASLVTHIFDEVWRQSVRPEASEQDKQQARERLTEEIQKAEGAVRQAAGQVGVAENALKEAEDKRDDALKLLTLKKIIEPRIAEQVTSAARAAGWQKPLDNLVELEATARDLNDSSERLRQLLNLALQELPRRFVVPALLTGGIALVLWWSTGFVPITSLVHRLLEQVAALLATVGALAAGLLVPLRSAAARLGTFATSVENARKAYLEEKAKGSAKSKQAEEARRTLQTTQQGIAAARDRLGELMRQQAALDPARRLGAFLEERVQSTQYRSQQGIISLVHRDFQRLSERMRDWRRERERNASRTPGDGEPRPIERIVLYIDDLDRCRPAHVVSTLEAVHLLLALDLFVVVVAVDSRWLIRALEVHYGEMLASNRRERSKQAERSSTARDYLEKIFQITYALPPIAALDVRGYLDDLTASPRMLTTGDESVGSTLSAPAVPSLRVASTSSDAPGTASTTAAAVASASTRATTAVPGSQAAANRDQPVAKAAFPLLQFADHERTTLKQLAFLLTTPRMAKRLVNVYRLLKSSRPELLQTEGRQRGALLLLTILFGRSEFSCELFRAINAGEAPFSDDSLPVVGCLQGWLAVQQEKSEGASAYDVAAIATLSRQFANAVLAPISVGDCRDLPPTLARYSFTIGSRWFAS